MKRVCLISPGHLATNPRLVKEAQALRDAGYQVTVIHGRFKKWGTENDVPIACQISKTLSVPFGPVEAKRVSYFRQNIVRHCARFLVKAKLNSIGMFECAHHPAVKDLTAAALAQRADLYIAHYVAALPAAARAAQKHNALFAFDAEDFHLGDLPDLPKHTLEKKLIQTIEDYYLPRAAYMTAASPMIAEAYAIEYGIPLPETIYNVFPKKNGLSTSSPISTVKPGPSVYWFSQTIGPGRGLEVAIDAISRSVSKPYLYLRGDVTDSYRADLRNFAIMAGVGDHLQFLEPAAPEELERLGSAFDLGFVGEGPQTRNRAIALTNKLFSYLLSGLPILASDIPAHRQLANDLGPAMSLFPSNDPESLANAIDDFFLNPSRLASARKHAWGLGQERFNWEVEQIRFLATVKRALAYGKARL